MNYHLLFSQKILSQNGQVDAFGYAFADSNEAYGPHYNWIEIAPEEGGSGTLVDGLRYADDHAVWPIDLPFPFNFYGDEYQQIGVSTNGLFFFTDTIGASNFNNFSIPTQDQEPVPEPIIAGLWDDLIFYEISKMYTHSLGDRFYYRILQCLWLL